MPKKILLADDSITIQKVVELTFSDGDYEVTAVNNGAKALQKLNEMRPDIILSDIIMPEKNGYEVCEYVKSHPEFRNIPVVLLTGTFEPFDPDRAEKAGCDAVVTKPFESQSLIHKVEELISAAGSSAAAPAPVAEEPEAAPSPWMEDTPLDVAATSAPEPPPPSPFSTTSGNFPPVAPDSPSPFSTSGGSFPTPPEAFTHDADIFGAAPAPQATTEMPFDTPSSSFDAQTSSPFGAPPPADAFSSETRAFTKMSFEEMQQLASPPTPPSLPETSPWDEPGEVSGGETRAFTKMSFDDFSTPAPAPEPEPESPFGAPPPADEFSGETRAFPRMSLDELQGLQSQTPSFSAPEPEPQQPTLAPEPEPIDESPWDEPAASPFGGGETRAFPKMSFDELQQFSSPAPAPTPEPEPQPEASADSPWGEPEPAAFTGGETRAFPKMSFEELQQLSSTPAPAPEPEPSPWEEPSAPAWSPTSDTGALDTSSATENFTTTAVPFVEPESPQFGNFDQPAEPEDMPFAAEANDEEEPIVSEPEPAEPLWSPMAAAEAEAEPAEPPVPSSVLAPESQSLPISRGESSGASSSAALSDDQIDRIARRVVELMSDQVVRNIAWEVIPDLAEMVVKERIRQLESEA
ncbi:MAG TPA: response regulator [Thermoanaerobaculia bacterium]|nr:response regulator [Thermoanaerobaculia bacterium]